MFFHSPSPVAFSVFGLLDVRWYGLAYMAAFFFGWWWVARYGRSRVNVDDLLFAIIIGVVVGGRLGFVLFYDPAYYLAHPLEVFYVWQGGMAFHGGLIGALLASWWQARRQGISWFTIGDDIVVPTAVGLALGRLANFANGEVYGTPTDVPWCVTYANVDALCRHPHSLYSAVIDAMTAITLLLTHRYTRWPAGRVGALFLMIYGAYRTVLDMWRVPNTTTAWVGELTGLEVGQWLSVAVFVAGVVVWYIAGRRSVRASSSDIAA